MPDIRPLTIADRSLVTEYLHRYPPDISEHTFTNLFIWQPSRPIFFTEIDNSLVFFVKSSGEEGEYLLYGPRLAISSYRISYQLLTATAGSLVLSAFQTGIQKIFLLKNMR